MFVDDEEPITEEQVQSIVTKYGGGWWTGDTIKEVMKLTPLLVANYCRHMGFKPFPKPVYDKTDGSIRYQYWLGEARMMRDEEQVETVNIVAKFGFFPHFPLPTLTSCIEAVLAIAKSRNKNPLELVEEIVTAPPRPTDLKLQEADDD